MQIGRYEIIMAGTESLTHIMHIFDIKRCNFFRLVVKRNSTKHPLLFIPFWVFLVIRIVMYVRKEGNKFHSDSVCIDLRIFDDWRSL